MRIERIEFLGFALHVHDRKKRLVNPTYFAPHKVVDGRHLNAEWRGWEARIDGDVVAIARTNPPQRFEVPRSMCVVEYRAEPEAEPAVERGVPMPKRGKK